MQKDKEVIGDVKQIEKMESGISEKHEVGGRQIPISRVDKFKNARKAEALRIKKKIVDEKLKGLLQNEKAKKLLGDARNKLTQLRQSPKGMAMKDKLTRRREETKKYLKEMKTKVGKETSSMRKKLKQKKKTLQDKIRKVETDKGSKPYYDSVKSNVDDSDNLTEFSTDEDNVEAKDIIDELPQEELKEFLDEIQELKEMKEEIEAEQSRLDFQRRDSIRPEGTEHQYTMKLHNHPLPCPHSENRSSEKKKAKINVQDSKRGSCIRTDNRRVRNSNDSNEEIEKLAIFFRNVFRRAESKVRATNEQSGMESAPVKVKQERSNNQNIRSHKMPTLIQGISLHRGI